MTFKEMRKPTQHDSEARGTMAVDKTFLRQQILTQLDRCTALAYAAGSHFEQHSTHAPGAMQAQAEADARLIHLIEDYAAIGVPVSQCHRRVPGSMFRCWLSEGHEGPCSERGTDGVSLPSGETFPPDHQGVDASGFGEGNRG